MSGTTQRVERPARARRTVSDLSSTGSAADDDPRGLPPRLDGGSGASVVFVAALVAFGVQSLGWRMERGRDWQDYLVYWHELFQPEPLFRTLMLARTPLAPAFYGPLFDLGPGWLELGAAVLFGVTVTCWVAVARTIGPRSAVLVAALLVVVPGFGWFFHQLGSDPVFACVLSILALATVRAARHPTALGFAGVGALVFLLVLARPSGQPFLLLALLPLGLRVPWRRRLVWSAATGIVAVGLLAAWSGYNADRFDDFTVARGGNAGLPLWRALIIDHIVHEDNGPASRELARAIRSGLLNREPYRSWGFDVSEVLASESTWVIDDLAALSDATWGFADDFQHLRDAGVEAVRRHPATYAKGVAVTLLAFGLYPYSGPPVQPSALDRYVPPAAPDDAPLDRDGGRRRLPGAAAGVYTVWANSLLNNWALPPSPRYTVVDTVAPVADPTWGTIEKRAVVFRDPADAARYAELTRLVRRGLDELPVGARSPLLADVLTGLSLLLLPLGWWGLFALGVIVRWRRAQGLWPIGLLALASGAVILLTSLGFPPDLNYSMAFTPVFLIFCCGAFAASRRLAA